MTFEYWKIEIVKCIKIEKIKDSVHSGDSMGGVLALAITPDCSVLIGILLI